MRQTSNVKRQMPRLYAILLAGGHGTRLWPVSRKGVPKQLQPVLGEDTLLKATWKRLRKGLPASRVLVVTGEAMAPLVRADLPELPEENLLVEPARRDTAAAVGFGAAVALSRDPRASVVTVNSDAFVRDEEAYWRTIRLALRAASRPPKALALVGIRPTYPETGYGYIKAGRPLGGGVFEVEGFREKPDRETAEAYLAEPSFLWNPTLLVAEAATLMKAFRRHLPKTAAELERVRRAWKTPRRAAVLERAFARIAPVSIDYGILEKEKGMRVAPADFGWADVGHWRAVHDVLATEEKANVRRGPHVGVDSRGNLLYSFTGKLIATAGLEDIVLIETEDVILCCPKSRAQDVKKLVEELEKKDLEKYL